MQGPVDKGEETWEARPVHRCRRRSWTPRQGLPPVTWGAATYEFHEVLDHVCPFWLAPSLLDQCWSLLLAPVQEWLDQLLPSPYRPSED